VITVAGLLDGSFKTQCRN